MREARITMSTIRPRCGGGGGGVGVGVDRKWRVATIRLLHGCSSSLFQLVYPGDAPFSPCYLCACTLLCVSNKVRTSRAERLFRCPCRSSGRSSANIARTSREHLLQTKYRNRRVDKFQLYSISTRLEFANTLLLVISRRLRDVGEERKNT